MATLMMTSTNGAPPPGPAPTSSSPLSSHKLIPIAHLSPPSSVEMPTAATPGSSQPAAIRGTVGVTWPYSAVTHTISFVLADAHRDSNHHHHHHYHNGGGRKHLRDEVRVAFVGRTLARAVVDTGVGPGDEVVLSLDGAEWVAEGHSSETTNGNGPNASASQDKGAARVPWQLRFVRGVTMEVVLADSGERRVVDLRGVAEEEATTTTATAATNGNATTSLQEAQGRRRMSLTPDVEPVPPPETPAAVTAAAATPLPSVPVGPYTSDGTYASPAFLKRARLSYGALFEDGFDADMEKDFPRWKKPRFSGGAALRSSWRVVSRETTPTSLHADANPSSPHQADEGMFVMVDEGTATMADGGTSVMVDESIQTDLPMEDYGAVSTQPAAGIVGEFGQLLSPTAFLPAPSSGRDSSEQRDLASGDMLNPPVRSEEAAMGRPPTAESCIAEPSSSAEPAETNAATGRREPTPQALPEERPPEMPAATSAEEAPASIPVSSPSARPPAPEFISLSSSPPRQAPLQAAPIQADFGNLHWNIRSQEPESDDTRGDHRTIIADALMEPPPGTEHPLSSDAAEPVEEDVAPVVPNLEDADADAEADAEVEEARLHEFLGEGHDLNEEEADRSGVCEDEEDYGEEEGSDASDEDLDEEDEEEEEGSEVYEEGERDERIGSLGDYGATNYEHIDPDDDEDMPEEQRVYGRQHQRGEYYEEDEEDEADYDAEGDYEEEVEGHEHAGAEAREEDEEPEAVPLQKPSSGPIVIDLLSDSEDEADNPPPAAHARPPAPRSADNAEPGPSGGSQPRVATAAASKPTGAPVTSSTQNMTAGDRGPSPSYAPPPKDEDDEEEESNEEVEEVEEGGYEDEDEEFEEESDGSGLDESEGDADTDGGAKSPSKTEQEKPLHLHEEGRSDVEGRPEKSEEVPAAQQGKDKDAGEKDITVYKDAQEEPLEDVDLLEVGADRPAPPTEKREEGVDVLEGESDRPVPPTEKREEDVDALEGQSDRPAPPTENPDEDVEILEEAGCPAPPTEKVDEDVGVLDEADRPAPPTEQREEDMDDAELQSMEQDLEAEMAVDPALTATDANVATPGADVDMDREEETAPDGGDVDMDRPEDVDMDRPEESEPGTPGLVTSNAPEQRSVDVGTPPLTASFASDVPKAPLVETKGVRLQDNEQTTQGLPPTPMATQETVIYESQSSALEKTGDGGGDLRDQSQVPADDSGPATQEVVEAVSVAEEEVVEEHVEVQELEQLSRTQRGSFWGRVARARELLKTAWKPETASEKVAAESSAAPAKDASLEQVASQGDVPARSTRSKTSQKADAVVESSPPQAHDSGVALAKAAIVSKKARSVSRKAEAAPGPVTPARQGPVRHTRSRSKQISPESSAAALALSISKGPEADEEADTSVALAQSALSSSSRARGKISPRSKETSASIQTASRTRAIGQSEQELKALLDRALVADLQEYVPLRSIRNYNGRLLHVLGVVVADPKRPPARTRTREYSLTFSITDQDYASISGPGSPGANGPAAVVEVQIFRPFKESLPVVAQGDAVLLRDFMSVAAKDRGFVLRSGDASAWAVVDEESAAAAAASKDDQAHDEVGQDDIDAEIKAARAVLPQIRGAPVEVNDAEMLHMTRLRRWYGMLGGESRARLIERARRMDVAEEAAAAAAAGTPGRK